MQTQEITPDKTPATFPDNSIETDGKPHWFRRRLMLARQAIQEFTALDNTYTTRRKAESENDLYGQSDDQDRLIRRGKHSLNEINTGLSDTIPPRFL